MRRRRRIDPLADRPAYKQVADDIRDQIRLGILAAGAELPGETRIAAEYEVGVNTVRSALQLLRSERLVVTERGVGSRVRDREERSTMTIPPGARVTIRPADDDERRRFGLDVHEPVAVVETVEGVEVLPAYRVVLVAEGEPEPEGPPPGE
ncbi:winged helix-turn-helix domain-containing protein [Actinomadura sp. NPDC049382]|uniref:winged helix-turn-helix domain-containing protein n=1 Tax=Actinomadura sp. NPDC049382 TaxID=3158220 RepID=UPI003443E635